MSVKSEKLTRTGVFLMYLLTFIYVVSICWINFHGALWCQMDIYTYAFEGRLMHEARSCFPEGWIFGNQYHIISSPNISALFYGLVHDSMTSLAIASSLSTVLVLLSFWWSFHKYMTKTGMAAGLMCIGGGIIFGTNASTYISGLQVLYTMASFYASYLIVLILTLGCWLRLKKKDRTPWAMLALAIPLNFAAGMQSLREMLILVIPLMIIEGIGFLYGIAKRKTFRELDRGSLLFIALVFVAELAGHFYMDSLHVATTPIIGDLQLDLSISGLAANFWASVKNILRISGLAIASDGLQYLPLSIFALGIVLCVLWSLYHIIKTRDDSALALLIVFSTISVLGVLFVGTFLMRTRDIYYFVYWLLAALSVVYCLQCLASKFIPVFVVALLAISAINYGYSFIPDYVDYRQNHRTLEAFTQKLVEDGIEVVYVDSTPIFAACSGDRIISQSYWLNVGMDNGYPLYFFPSDKYVPAYDDDHYAKSLICISGNSLKTIPTLPDSFQDTLYSQMEYYDEIRISRKRFMFYKPTARILDPSPESALR
ncbi:MAG: hypothetical protein IJP49_02830 [Bacteroidales bacterium]|nr:hypothetical protein [Bacteroidales bacterium]